MHQPPTSDHYDAFLAERYLQSSLAVEAERGLIHWSREALGIVNDGYSKLPESRLMGWPAVGLLLHMLHRAFEHLEGAIVSFTTGSAVSSEGLSRAVVELAISIRYILVGQPEGRLVAFLREYVDLEEKRLRNWRKESDLLSKPDREIHEQAIEHRRSGIVAISGLITRLQQDFTSCGAPMVAEAPWPNIAERFRELGEMLTYRTFYARMSSQVHSDAEETIRYFLARVSNDPAFAERMAMETICFSRLGLYFAAQCFLSACTDYCRRYEMVDATTFLGRGLKAIGDELRTIAFNVASA